MPDPSAMSAPSLFLLMGGVLCGWILPVDLTQATPVPPQIEKSCMECHDKDTHKGGLDLTAQSFDLRDRAARECWVRVHDRVEKGEMPPKAEDMAAADRAALVQSLDTALY